MFNREARSFLLVAVSPRLFVDVLRESGEVSLKVEVQDEFEHRSFRIEVEIFCEVHTRGEASRDAEGVRDCVCFEIYHGLDMICDCRDVLDFVQILEKGGRKLYILRCYHFWFFVVLRDTLTDVRVISKEPDHHLHYSLEVCFKIWR